MSRNTPRASDMTAVVVNHDGGEQVMTCLRHLHAQVPPVDHVILVDRGSTDGSPAGGAPIELNHAVLPCRPRREPILRGSLPASERVRDAVDNRAERLS